MAKPTNLRALFRQANTLLSIALSSATILAQTENGAWKSYGADQASSKYAPLNQINKSNVQDLQIAWRWESVDRAILNANPGLWTWKYEATPLMVDEVLYTSTSLSQVAAIHAVSGQTIWSYDPGTYRDGSPPNNGFLHRGVAYWADGNDRRIFIGTGDAYLIALDAETGQPIPEFGQNGRVDLALGLRRGVSRGQYGVTSPPVICRDVVMVGSSIWDYPVARFMAPGDVRGFDPVTGEQLWVFESIPQATDFGAETWEGDSGQRFGNTNVWAPMSCDDELGYVYLPFGTPTNDYYGGERGGDNLFAESLVCLNAQTGTRVWHYQIVRHGLWDYDLPAAPNLVDITVDGNAIRAVAQVTKHGSLFVFDRVTGEPVWPIEERSVPASTVPGEQASPTQPFPTKPAPFEQQGATVDDLIDFTTALRQQALTIFQNLDSGPLFTPPGLRGTITVPGVSGGGSWAGAAFHPKTGRLYVPSIKGTWTLRVWRNTRNPVDYAYKGAPDYGPVGPQGLPLMKPPYGRITAIDLNEGEHVWRAAVGEGPRNHSAIRHLNLDRLGWARRIFVLVTDSLLFAVQEGININRGGSPRGNASEINTVNSDPALLAFDLESGDQVAKIALPSNAAGSPMTYMANGVQYIAVPVGGASQLAELVALTTDSAVIVIDDPDTGLPKTGQLFQNYPNPFNAGTTIEYEMVTAGRVSIAIYNIRGRRVRTLLDQTEVAGEHELIWDGADDRGLPLASGLYLVELKSDASLTRRKMILLR
jgi:quinoprotein glucose dehydrogenase